MQAYRRATLLVTNTGPQERGIQLLHEMRPDRAHALASGDVAGTHTKPYPDEENRTAPGRGPPAASCSAPTSSPTSCSSASRSTRRSTLRPELLSTHIALRSVAEALTIAATQNSDIEATELQAEYRPALTPLGNKGWRPRSTCTTRWREVRASPGGCTTTASRSSKQALDRLEHCPADCDESCYQCLRSFRNRFEHGLLDRKVGASLLRYLLYGEPPTLDAARLDLAADKLFADLQSRDLPAVDLVRDGVVDVPGVGPVTAPILATLGTRQWIIGVHGPLTLDMPPTQELHDAKEYGGVQVRLIDDMVIARNLPHATNLVIKNLT